MISRDAYHQRWEEVFALGKKYWFTGDIKNAIATLSEASRLVKSFPNDIALTSDDKRNIAQCHLWLGLALFSEYKESGIIASLLSMHDVEEIKACFNYSLLLLKDLIAPNAEHPYNPDQRLLACNYQALAELYAFDYDDEKLIDKCNQALNAWDLCEDANGKHRQVAMLLALKGQVYQNLRKFPDAKVCYVEALKRLAEIKEDNLPLKDQDIRVAAACYHQGGIVEKYMDELINSRHLFMEEIACLRKLSNFEAEDMEDISSAYDQLSKLGIHGAEKELFHFAKNVFSPGFFRFFSQPSYQELNKFFYHLQESTWEKASYLSNLNNLVALICQTCHMQAFPDTALKRFLQDNSHLQKLEEKLKALSHAQDNSLIDFARLQQRLMHVEHENVTLRKKLAEVSEQLNIMQTSSHAKADLEIKTEPVEVPIKVEESVKIAKRTNLHPIGGNGIFNNTRSKKKQSFENVTVNEHRM